MSIKTRSRLERKARRLTTLRKHGKSGGIQKAIKKLNCKKD